MSVIKMVYRDLGMFWMSVLFKGLFSRVSLDFVLSEALQSFFYLFVFELFCFILLLSRRAKDNKYKNK